MKIRTTDLKKSARFTVISVPHFLPFSALVKSDLKNEKTVKIFVYALIKEKCEGVIQIDEKTYSLVRGKDSGPSVDLVYNDSKWSIKRLSAEISNVEIALFLDGSAPMTFMVSGSPANRFVSWKASAGIIEASDAIFENRGEYILSMDRADVDVVDQAFD